MKKLVVCLLLAVLIAGSVSALDWESYPDAVKPGNWVINAGIGFGTPLAGSVTIPPLTVIVDYMLPLGGLPFSVGGQFGFTASEWKFPGYSYEYTGLVFAGRFGYHPNFELGIPLDLYAVLSLGFYSYGGKYKGTGGSTSVVDYSTFLWGIDIGGRWFFTDTIGAFLEVGYNRFAYVTGGISFKF
jgi:hypothetical protein